MPAEQSPTARARIRMVDLFAGPGGLDVAARWLGIDVHGVEWDSDACATRGLADLETKQGDVYDYGPDDFRDDDASEQPDLTILAGGPPCQTYTVAGNGAGRGELDRVLGMVDRMINRETMEAAHAELHEKTGDERTGLVLEPLRWAIEAFDAEKPYDVIVLEQVPAVLPVWKAIGEALTKIGYQYACEILHTEEFGVPQTRRRAILIASRLGSPVMPAATHRRYRKGTRQHEGSAELLPWVSMGTALKRENFSVRSNYGTGGDPKARGERSWEEPSATVTGKISRNRLKDTKTGAELDRFTAGEAGQLQTFPPDYPWSGRNTAQQIGNAIPPRLATHVLAAALGMTFDTAALDKAVEGKWKDTRGGVISLSPIGE
ncbi:DNA cytosine methyltransferase [Nocardia sp. NPDC059246]|uniref:DNA cytosine methyltransferase n=1 Tax=unclassified Nocardia TaxID=2637762 RepID=UPI0036B5F546